MEHLSACWASSGNCLLSSPRGRRGRPQWPRPLPRCKDNEVGQLLSGAMAQVRPAPRGNPVFGYKLTRGRAMSLENQATPAKWSAVTQRGTANRACLQWQDINSPQALLSLTKCPQFLRRNKVQMDFALPPPPSPLIFPDSLGVEYSTRKEKDPEKKIWTLPGVADAVWKACHADEG